MLLLPTNTAVGAGLHLNTTTNALTVDDDTVYISLSGNAELNTYPGSNGAGAGSGSVAFEAVDPFTGEQLATLASVSGDWTYLSSAAAQPVFVAAMYVPPGTAIAFEFLASFCNSANVASQSDSLVVNVYKHYPAATTSPTASAPATSSAVPAVVGAVVGGLFGLAAMAAVATVFMRGFGRGRPLPLRYQVPIAGETGPIINFSSQPTLAADLQHGNFPMAREVPV